MNCTNIRVLLHIMLNAFRCLGVSLDILVARLCNKKGQVANGLYLEMPRKEALFESAVLLYG
jgi:hypothetical protein